MGDSCINSIPFTDFDFNPQIDSCHPIRLPPNIELGPCGDPYFKPISFPQICPEKTCVVFGNHDAFPADPRCRPSPKRDPPNINSLGAAVGLIHSSYKMSTAEQEIAVLQPQRFATIIKTMAEIYIKPITEWTTETLDAVMQEGQKLFMDSNNDPAIDQMNSSIYNQFENTIRREFDYESMTFHIELNRKYYLNEHRAIHDSEGTSSSDTPLDDLFETLKSFYLQDGIYGLLMLGDWYLMIWRQQEIYFIADYYGRRITDFRSDREDGFAMVISLQSLENVIHLILNLSDLEKDTTFSLREMRLVRLTTTDGRTQTRDYLSRKNEYKVINDDYVYLKARLHMSLNPNDPLRNRSALPTAVATLLAAKIDVPGTWTGKQLDNLMCYGLSFCRCCWNPCLDNMDPMHIEDFPQKLKLGQFFVKFSLHTRIVSGIWHCIPYYKHDELSTAIEELFEAGHNKLIIQIDHQIYSVWSKNGFIYLFDPFRHRVQGDVDPNNIDEKSASLRVFRSLDLFLNVFNMILGEITQTSKFYIHSLKILEIAARDAQKKWVMTEYSEEMQDIMSLNEYICYEEDEIRCEELADISDYGDDDQGVPSELPSIPSSSTIGGEMEEEGEGGYGNIAGVESSSSHGDMRRKNKRKSGSKHGKKVRVYEASKESFVPFDDDKVGTYDATRTKSKFRKRGMSSGDHAGDTMKEYDEPSGKSRRKRSSKTGTGYDSDDKKEQRRKRSSKAGTGSDSDGRKVTDADTSKSGKDKKKQGRGRDGGDEPTDESGKETGKGRDKGRKKNAQREKELEEKKEGKEGDIDRENDSKSDAKSKTQDEKDGDKEADNGKDGELGQGKQSEEGTEKEDRGRRESKADKGRLSKEKPKWGQPTAKGKKGELGKQDLEKEKHSGQTDRDIIGKPDSALKDTSSLNISQIEREIARQNLIDTITESQILDNKIFDGKKVKKGQKGDVPTHKELKTRTDELHKGMKKKQDEKDHKSAADQEKRERYLRRLNRMIMDENPEKKELKNGTSRIRDESMDRLFTDGQEDRKSVIIPDDGDKIESFKRTDLFVTEQERREFEEKKKQHEKSKQSNSRTIEGDGQFKNRPTNESIKNRYASVESFRASYGELFLQKNEDIMDYEAMTGLLNGTDTEIIQDSSSEQVRKRKGKKVKGRRKKGVKNETQIKCDFEPSKFAIEGWNMKKKICRKQTVNDICCSVLTKKICNKQKIETSMDDIHIQLSSSRDGRYPGFNECPTELIAIQSRSSSYNSFLRSFHAAFQCTDRVLVLTTWNNFVVFRYCSKRQKAYYIYSGCTCNLNRFRHMDLNSGTAGLSRLSTIQDVITFIKFYKKPKRQTKEDRKEKIEILLQKYANC